MNDKLQPDDQPVRARFIEDIDRNYSVIAPAGVGKTAAIVERVAALAEKRPEVLPKLVVVTYTNRAADEMQQRARNAVLNRPDAGRVLNPFNRAFFGTIHSFCLRLLQSYGHFLGLGSELGQANDDDRLWRAFARQYSSETDGALSEARWKRLTRHVSVLDLMELARKVPAETLSEATLPPFPELDFSALLHEPPNRKSKGGVEGGQKLVREWLDEFHATNAEFLPVPVYEKGGNSFQEMWKAAFGPLHEWIGSAALIAASRIALEFRKYRLARGLLTFDDQIALAVELMRHPVAGRKIRAEEFHVILDEAQDTDPRQFQLLLEIARPVDAEGLWPETRDAPPRPGRFCMVGDPQQSIYGERADLAFYLEIERRLAACNAAGTLTFETTFRCDQAIVDLVNAATPAMLNGVGGQVGFVRLGPRPGVLAGQVVRVEIPPRDPDDKARDDISARHEARQFVAWLKQQDLKKLRAENWSEVAILCPRIRWFAPFSKALMDAGLKVQAHSTRERMGDSPAFAWSAALVTVLAEPGNGFEIVGVLREIYGISDQELFDFCQQDGTRFQIQSPCEGDCIVAQKLNELREIRLAAQGLPLRDAVANLLEQTKLKARLRSLGPVIGGSECEILDALVVRSGEAEMQSLTLKEWAGQLREEFSQPASGETIDPDAVQLITCQKAKGLQWSAVIIPFFFREIKDRPPDYPVRISHLAGERPRASFDKAGVPAHIEALQQQHREQELQRILYVAMTRAKHTLALVDDSKVFSSKKRSFADLLSVKDGVNESCWKQLPTRLTGDDKLIRDTVVLTSGAKQELEPVSETIVAKARNSARHFVQRKLPHSLARHFIEQAGPSETVASGPLSRGRGIKGEGEPSSKARPRTGQTGPLVFIEDTEARRELDAEWSQALRERAIEYGIWWHDLCENLPWSSGVGAWKANFEMNVIDCPDRERASREWRLFLESELAVFLATPGLRFHAELPIFWKPEEELCIEGLIDLAVFGPEKNSWTIIDWKTDKVAEENIETLVENYRPQITAYLQAISEMTGCPTQSSVFSTVTGKWIIL